MRYRLLGAHINTNTYKKKTGIALDNAEEKNSKNKKYREKEGGTLYLLLLLLSLLLALERERESEHSAKERINEDAPSQTHSKKKEDASADT